MKRWVVTCLSLLLLCAFASAQQPQSLYQNWTEVITLAPPPLLNSQSFSSSTATGFSTTTTGGSIAAGTYRCGVTFFTATNTETPLSTDTATTSTITTTGSTSTVTIQAPLAVGVGGNVVGWRPYCGASGGAAGAETVVTINNTVCALSSSSTPSCALTSPAVLTLQSQFAGGGGGPASPGTAIFPPVANAVNTALFENSQQTYRAVYWTVSGTAPSACTFNMQTGTAPGTLANIGQTITCTSSGAYAPPLNTTAAFSGINLATYTAGDTTTKVTFYYTSAPYGPPVYFVNAVPTGNCVSGSHIINTAAASASTVLYVCQPANTFTAQTVP
jgi:hypothetical protein